MLEKEYKELKKRQDRKFQKFFKELEKIAKELDISILGHSADFDNTVKIDFDLDKQELGAKKWLFAKNEKEIKAILEEGYLEAFSSKHHKD